MGLACMIKGSTKVTGFDYSMYGITDEPNNHNYSYLNINNQIHRSMRAISERHSITIIYAVNIIIVEAL